MKTNDRKVINDNNRHKWQLAKLSVAIGRALDYVEGKPDLPPRMVIGEAVGMLTSAFGDLDDSVCRGQCHCGDC